MNKLKSVFQRSQKTTEERRPHQFIKRHSSTTSQHTLEQINNSPTISLSELSESERGSFESCWKDLDPFGLGKIGHPTVLKFLSGCTLDNSKLKKILALFDTINDGLYQRQFYAMLRLVAHAQNGRKISKALVYLSDKAPLPEFHTQAIKALIKPTNENKWQDKPSHMDEYASCRPYESLFVKQTKDEAQKAPSPLFYPSTPTHSRSKSAGHANYLTQGSPLHSSRSSLSLHELDSTHRSLLLTQKFVYQSPSLKRQTLPPSSHNPFYSVIPDIHSPFGDEHISEPSFDFIPSYSSHSLYTKNPF
ncbi:hypothetical protein BY458DRAFT_490386 [Sporodiniella umbellata]|nr:hypothetical protein BY458DRAFT_490386 [Sporodiniella umbellata]